MSTVSGVFPNAITPSFAPSQDPAEQARLRRLAEQTAFAPIEETDNISASRRGEISQPGRLEAEQSLQAATPRGNEPVTAQQQQVPANGSLAEPEQIERPGTQAVRPAEETQARADSSEQIRQQQADRAQAREEEKLQQDIELIQQLAARDREVRNHEQAHQAVGGQYAGAMALTYKQGPDGKRYAVAGEVPIDVGKVQGDPQATLQKAERVRRAALAPAEPSAQDRQVAALASQIALEAQTEIRQNERVEAEKASEERSEQRELNEADEKKTEANSQDEDRRAERAAEENQERLQEILQKTSEAVETALDAAYRTQPQKEVGFNLDTLV